MDICTLNSDRNLEEVATESDDVTNKATMIEQRIRHVHEDLWGGWQAPEGVKRSLQMWRERTNQKDWRGRR